MAEHGERMRATGGEEGEITADKGPGQVKMNRATDSARSKSQICVGTPGVRRDFRLSGVPARVGTSGRQEFRPTSGLLTPGN